MGVKRFAVTRWRGFGAERVRGLAVLSLFGEDSWPLVRASLRLDGEGCEIFYSS